MTKRKGQATSGLAKKQKGPASSSRGGLKADASLLSKLMEQHEMESEGISFAQILKDLGMNDRNTGWRNVWKDLIRQKYIEPSSMGDGGAVFTSAYKLTEAGVEIAATDEYKQARAAALANQPKTNDELHDRIKKKLMNNRAVQIFDLLHEHGSLTRTELSGILGISDRGGPFSYGLKQLKTLGYVEVDAAISSRGNKKLCLTAKAFLSPKQATDADVEERADQGGSAKSKSKEERHTVIGKDYDESTAHMCATESKTKPSIMSGDNAKTNGAESAPLKSKEPGSLVVSND